MTGSILYNLEIFCLCLIWRLACVKRRRAAFDSDQSDTQPIELEEHAVEGGLIGQLSRQDGRSRWFVPDLQWGEPSLPGRVKVTFDANVIVHMRPPVQICSTACRCSIARTDG